MSNTTNTTKMALMAGTAAVCIGVVLYLSNNKKETPVEDKKVESSVATTDGKKEADASKAAAPADKSDAAKDAPKEEAKKDASAEKKEEVKGETPASDATVTASEFKVTDPKRPAAIFPDKSTITVGEVQEMIHQAPNETLENTPEAKLYKFMLSRLVSAKVLSDAAKAAGIDKSPEYLKKVEEAKETVKQSVILDREVNKVLTEAVLQEKYKELVAILPPDEEFELNHILFKTKEEAEKVLQDLKSGKGDLETRFTQAVISHSVDNSTKGKKGNVGWLRKSEFKNSMVANTAPGTLVSEAVKLFDQGYSVLMVKGKRPAQPPAFEQVKETLKTQLKPQYAVQVVDNMRKEAGLKVTGLDAQPLELPKMPPIPKLGTDPKDMPKMPEMKDFSAVNEKGLDDSMVVGEFKDGSKITLKQVRENVDNLPPQLKDEPFHKIFLPVLLRVADTTLLTQKAKDEKVETSEDYMKKSEDAAKATLQNMYLQKELEGKITDQMLKDIYAEVSTMFPKDEMEINLRHIVVKTKDEALDLIKTLKKDPRPTKFDEMVKEQSIDASTKDKNGEIGYIPKSKLAPDIAAVVSKASKATLLPEPLQLGDEGYSVMRVEDKRRAQPPAFEKIAPQLVQAAQQRESAKILQKLMTDSKVELRDLKGNIVPLSSLIKPAS